ncbi:enoyl-CoA hydratase/isomerase family protein [Lysinibacillus yapensis]|uniref:Enoyl-CoA hydratase/isomerase family protein n=1 Tax=Ureibacillus yapensis TaxID=2304605 RepID=A0A396SL42_9BACL|nr:enoyl-CoA hydratase/isomerase family protein [Lysinibacillus yapensis]RHW39747.1 enoyl-CoA hydratase/isomerase family protein [Lysinibacillus yapensis]
MAYKIETYEDFILFTIDRQEKRNAVNGEVMKGLKEAVALSKEQDHVKFFVITGSGDKAFCSGGDLSEFHRLKTEEQAFGMLSEMGAILYDLATLEIPTIALVNGAAVGGGCEIATACDYRLVAGHAKCGFIQGTLAITSGWGGGTYLLERGLRHDYALKMLSDATTYDARQLYEIGWATKLFDNSGERALNEFIAKMRNLHPTVLRAYKEIQLRKWKESKMYNRVMEEIRLCAKLWESDVHHEAVNRFLNKSN